jgi:hypothetical protein
MPERMVNLLHKQFNAALALPDVQARMAAGGLNWTCLAGAMSELNYKADIVDWVETWTFNAPKCMAVFKPVTRSAS